MVLVTAHSDVELAVEAPWKKSAADFVTKTLWENERLLATLMAALNLRRARMETDELRRRNNGFGRRHPSSNSGMIGTAPAMQRVFGAIRRTAPTDANVLILGRATAPARNWWREKSTPSARAAPATKCVLLRGPWGAVTPAV